MYSPKDMMGKTKIVLIDKAGKERRISSSVKSQKFAGTDFSYNDMESKLN